jgi:hypothetical protein
VGGFHAGGGMAFSKMGFGKDGYCQCHRVNNANALRTLCHFHNFHLGTCDVIVFKSPVRDNATSFLPSLQHTRTFIEMASSTAALLERARQRNRLRQENQTPATPSSPVLLPLDLNSSPNPFGIGSSSNAPVLRTSTIQLKSFGDRTLKRIKLTDDSEAEFKRYIEARSTSPC